MYTDKDSSLINDLRTKYGEEGVRLFRKWEIIVKKMVDYRNHRRFTLKCIKASITPISCKLKNPLLYKSSRSYQIIHKVEKQLLYERIRNINSILATLDKQRENQYQKFKDTLNQNNLEHEQYLARSRTFINRIKEHRHDKIKNKHIDKFKKLYFKRFGYHHNISRHTTSFDNIDHNSQALSRQSNVPSNFSTRTTNHSSTSSIPAIPMPPYLPPMQQTSNQQPTTQHLDNQFPTIHVPATQTNGSSIFLNPPHPGTIIPSTKRPQLCHYPQIPPQKHTSLQQNKQPTNYHPRKQMNSDQMSAGSSNNYNNITINSCNLIPSQCRAHTELKQDNSRVVLTADKGVAMVIMDQQDYITKAQTLLQDTNTYKVLPKDPTSHLKNKLITLLKDIKQTGGLSTQKYKQLYPTSAVPPSSMAYLKSIKQAPPSVPLFPVGGPSHMGCQGAFPHHQTPGRPVPHHLKNTQHFIQQLQGKKLEPGETITSFDVKALFTSVPVQPSIQIVKQRLQQDNTLPQRTSMSIPQITSLLRVLPFPHLLPLPG